MLCTNYSIVAAVTNRALRSVDADAPNYTRMDTRRYWFAIILQVLRLLRSPLVLCTLLAVTLGKAAPFERGRTHSAVHGNTWMGRVPWVCADASVEIFLFARPSTHRSPPSSVAYMPSKLHHLKVPRSRRQRRRSWKLVGKLRFHGYDGQQMSSKESAHHHAKHEEFSSIPSVHV